MKFHHPKKFHPISAIGIFTIFYKFSDQNSCSVNNIISQEDKANNYFFLLSSAQSLFFSLFQEVNIFEMLKCRQKEWASSHFKKQYVQGTPSQPATEVSFSVFANFIIILTVVIKHHRKVRRLNRKYDKKSLLFSGCNPNKSMFVT